MKKNNNNGFLLTETLIMTSFVSGILIFLFIQFTSLNKGYEEAFKYNTVEGIYALEDIKNFILSESNFLDIVATKLNDDYIDVSSCDFFENKDYCKKLFELENVKVVLITNNEINLNKFDVFDQEFLNFISKINKKGTEKYRIIVKFNDNIYATLRL